MTTRDSFDLDSLLDPSEPAPPSRRPLILWLVALGLLLLFAPLYLVASTISADTARLENELSQIQLALADEPTADPTIQAVQTQVNQTQTQANQLAALQSGLVANQVDWPAVVAAIGAYDLNQLTLTSLTQTDNRLTLVGEAVDDSAVIGYAQQLEATDLFNRVVVQSITLLPTPTATATPTPTLTMTASPTPADDDDEEGGGGGSTPRPTITATPDYRDEYEVDDAAPRPIFVGQSQLHNFFPDFDVDNAFFLAKSGRIYQITTANLAPGVDTFIRVTIGDVVLTNDDDQAGTLASEMAFQVPGGDIDVFIEVTNRGQYGPEMSYQLAVKEIVPTAEPTRPPDPTATQTLPPPPTATLAPTDTPSLPPRPTVAPTVTSTPDLRDAYEPDDGPPAAIAVGETQTHNFYPAGDVDRLSFITKAGRFYQVATSNLALGVDTSLDVGVNDIQWHNDDYASPGTGNFASSVCFPAAIDSTAAITVTNKMQQFTPDTAYNVSVAEVPALNVSADQLAFGPVPAGGPNPPTQTLQVTGDSTLAWTATTSGSAWLQVAPTSGGAPARLDVTADIGGLTPGTYQDTLTLAWASLCRRPITVTLQVDAPASDQTNTIMPPDVPVQTAGDTTHHSRFAKRAAQQPAAVSFVIIVELKTRTP